MNTIFRNLAAFGAAALSQIALAGAPLQVTMQHDRIIQDAAGKEKLQPADLAKPGDVLQYRAVYTNKGVNPIGGMDATIPIPVGTEYMPGSALPAAGALASVDGVRFDVMPLRRIVPGADGARHIQDVPLSEYRAIRWHQDMLPSNTARQFQIRVRLAVPNAAPARQ